MREGHALVVSCRSYRFGDSLLQMARVREHHELLAAVRKEDDEEVTTLLTRTPVSIKPSNDTGKTALHAACYGKHLAGT